MMRHEGGRGVGPVVKQTLVDLDDLPKQLHALLDVRKVLLALGDEIAQGAPALGVLADAAQGSIGTQVQRIDLEHLAQRRFGVTQAFGLPLLDVRHQHQQFLAQGRLAGRGQHAPGALGDLGQLAHQLGQLDQAFAHGVVGRFDLEDAQDGAVGGGGVAERTGIEVGQHFEMALALGLILGDANQ